MNINKQIIYNLTEISGFNCLLQTGDILDEYKNYFTTKNYFTKSTKSYLKEDKVDDFSTIKSYFTNSDKTYKIVNYNKDILCQDIVMTYGLLRSVILSGQEVVCFSPPKSISAEQFMIQYPTKQDNILAQEFVEGTMINLFFDTTGRWQIATRNSVGAFVSFYTNSSATFNQMFLEACVYNHLDINTLNPKYCYSFVLQHPLNRIVVPIHHPQLYLIAVYEIKQSNAEVVVYEHDMIDIMSSDFFNVSSVKVPETYVFETYSELIEKYASLNTEYNVMGVVVKNMSTGERTKFRNPVYEEVKQLRGNQPKLQYQYLCLRQSGKLTEFLKYYPETREEMLIFREQLHSFTNELHKKYISCYIKKEQALKLYSAQFRTHMFKLHQHFVNDLRPNGLYVTISEVIKYVNHLHPSLLMYSLNYNLRKMAINM